MKEKLAQTYLLFQAPEGCPAAHPSSYGSPDQTTSYQQDCQMCPTHYEGADPGGKDPLNSYFYPAQ